MLVVPAEDMLYPLLKPGRICLSMAGFKEECFNLPKEELAASTV